jgi:hypothetical protein
MPDGFSTTLWAKHDTQAIHFTLAYVYVLTK